MATLAFRVYLDDGSGNPTVLVYDTLQKALTNIATLQELTTGHSYTVTVHAVNEIGESLSSNELTVYAGIAPTQIQDLDSDASTTTSVTVRWTLPSSNGGLQLTHFTVYHDIGQTGVFTPVEITDTFLRTFTLAGQSTGLIVDF